MPQQFENGSCSCWDDADQQLEAKGVRIERLVSKTGRMCIGIVTTDTNSISSPPKIILAKFCPFCGAKLKDLVAQPNAKGGE